MNETDHVFPLAEEVQHKLDEVKEEIVHPVSRKMHRSLSQNVWLAMVISVAAGIACGWIWGRRG